MYAGEMNMAQASAKSAYIGGTVEPQREAELPKEFERLNKALGFVDHSLNELFQRLEGKVVRPPVPSPAGAEKLASVGPSTGYGQEIHGYSRRADDIGERIQDLLRRLEV